MSLSHHVQTVSQAVHGAAREAALAPDVMSCAVQHFGASEIPAVLGALEPPFPETEACENNADFLDQARQFVLFAGVQDCIDRIVASQAHPSGKGAAGEKIEDGTTQGSGPGTCPGMPALQLLFGCFDFVLCELAPAHEAVRRQFFSLLEGASDQILRQNVLWAPQFWQYVETRAEVFREHVFSASNTANRIAVLGFCNHVTDLYYERNERGKYDSYQKDSFSDKFHARVRTFLANFLEFEDSTGLNKHFVSANREQRTPEFGEIKSGDDQLLDDIVRLQQVLKNPYHFLKHARDLAVQVESVSKLNTYFLSEEAKYAKVHPTRDIYRVQAPGEEPGARWFFPEAYWTSAFEESRDPAADKRVGRANLDSSKYRKLVLVQIFLVCNFYIHMSSSRKKELLTKIGAKPNTKHISEDYVQEHVAVKFSRVKNETLKSVRTWDSQLYFFLHSITQAEENWLGWLIYGKKEDGNSLISNKSISEADITSTEEKFKRLFNFKTKRYFNTHVTPQLSRRMKTKTGLEGLRVPDVHSEYGEKLVELEGKIGSAEDEQKAELNEEKMILIWKSIKGVRDVSWLKVDESVNMKDFGQDSGQDAGAKELKPSEGQMSGAQDAVGETASMNSEDVQADSKTSAPEAPETEAPETEVPKAEAPETEVPKAEAPETEAPETEVPKAEAPETEVPETEAPEQAVPTEQRKRKLSDPEEPPSKSQKPSPDKK